MSAADRPLAPARGAGRWTRWMGVLIFVAIFVAGGSSVGCWWSTQPSTPHRDVKLVVADLPELGAPNVPRVASTRVVVLGRFDTTAGNPVGGLYDRSEYEVSPLTRTYFYKDGAVEVFEHVSDGLRAAGLIVLKDYAGHAEPALLEPPLRARHPALLTATVTALQHDQIREKGDAAGDYQIGRIALDVRTTEPDGQVTFQRSIVVQGWIRYDPQTEFLRILGWKIAEALLGDPSFRASIGASGGATDGASGSTKRGA